ncbi:MAG TPA: DUF3857 domain-containing protein, partial [Burkholderiaceae bacterium]
MKHIVDGRAPRASRMRVAFDRFRRRWRAGWLLVALPGALACGPAACADWHAGPALDWVRPQSWSALPAGSVTAPGVAYGARYDLVDDQVRLLARGRAAYHHRVMEAATDKGVDELSHHEIEFDPSCESLTLNQLDVLRSGRRISRLGTVQVKVLQRERDLESRIYDGRETVAIDLADIRPGDTVELAYTIAGQNPVFGRHHAGGFDMQWSVPVMHVHRSLEWPQGLPLTVRGRRGAPEGLSSTAGGLLVRTWDLHDVPALHVEPHAPEGYEPYPQVEWTDFAGWGEVARWAEPLYPVPPAPGSGLRAAIERIAAQDATPDARVVDTLRLVQKQVRYLGIEAGAGSHRPSPPDLVWTRRFGDCKEKALLMVTMLRRLGVEAAPALVDTRRRDAVADDLPSYGSFDHVITRVRLAGVDYWLDPTRAPQAGTLSTIVQAAYGRALVLDGRSDALAQMPARTPARQEREIAITLDAGAGYDQPAAFTVHTTFHGGAADEIRDQLGDGERGELQRRYVNFYAGSYPGIRVAAPMDVRDDSAANELEVVEHYAIDRLWTRRRDAGRRADLEVPDLDSELRVPDETIRAMPLDLGDPRRLTVHLTATLPAAWPARSSDEHVDDPAFALTKRLLLRGRTLQVDYVYEQKASRVEPARVPAFARAIDRARRLTGDRVDTDDGATAAPSTPAAPMDRMAVGAWCSLLGLVAGFLLG